MNNKWVGWEVEDDLHVTISKVHLVKEGAFIYQNGDTESVCGKRIPRYATTNDGRDVCKKCQRWADKNGVEI